MKTNRVGGGREEVSKHAKEAKEEDGEKRRKKRGEREPFPRFDYRMAPSYSLGYNSAVLRQCKLNESLVCPFASPLSLSLIPLPFSSSISLSLSLSLRLFPAPFSHSSSHPLLSLRLCYPCSSRRASPPLYSPCAVA